MSVSRTFSHVSVLIVLYCKVSSSYHLESKVFFNLLALFLNSVSLLTFAISQDLIELCCICDMREHGSVLD